MNLCLLDEKVIIRRIRLWRLLAQYITSLRCLFELWLQPGFLFGNSFFDILLEKGVFLIILAVTSSSSFIDFVKSISADDVFVSNLLVFVGLGLLAHKVIVLKVLSILFVQELFVIVSDSLHQFCKLGFCFVCQHDCVWVFATLFRIIRLFWFTFYRVCAILLFKSFSFNPGLVVFVLTSELLVDFEIVVLVWLVCEQVLFWCH